jgi:hypothetical protein
VKFGQTAIVPRYTFYYKTLLNSYYRGDMALLRCGILSTHYSLLYAVENIANNTLTLYYYVIGFLSDSPEINCQLFLKFEEE